jgi:hypothetical protein
VGLEKEKHMLRQLAILLAAIALVAGGVAASIGLAGNSYVQSTISTITQTTGGGHTPVTICHKPGTPAEMTLVVDDDAVPGHLGHGDYLGECEPVVTTTGTTETTPTGTIPTTTTPTTPTTTTPTGPRCPPGMTPTAGKDGQPGNDECEFPKTTTTTAPPKPGNPVTAPPPVVVPATVAPPAPSVTAKPKPKPAAPKPLAKPKPKPPAAKPPKLTGNPKVDKCKDLQNGTMSCKGVVVIQGNG